MRPETDLKVTWLSGDNVADAFQFHGAVASSNRANVVDRDQPVASPDTVFDSLRVQIFSQRQLSEMSGGTKLLEFVDRILRKDLAQPIEAERSCEANVETLLEKTRLLQIARTELAQLEQSVTELDRQWNSRSAVSAEAAAHKAAQEAKTYFDNVMICAANVVSATNEFAEDVQGKTPALPEDIANWPIPDTFRTFHGDLNLTFTRLRDELARCSQSFSNGQ